MWLSIPSRTELRTLILTLQNLPHTADLRAATLLARKSVQLSRFTFDRAERTVSSPTLRTQFDLARHGKFLGSLRRLEQLVEHAGASVSALPNGELAIAIGGLLLSLQTSEEVFILSEVFLGGAYSMRSIRPTVVLDVGMNVGLASLYFALRPEVVRVHGFEPFPRTWERCLQNLSLNPGVAAKITPHSFGLAGRDYDTVAEFSDILRGNNSVLGLGERARKRGSIETARVALRRARDSFAQVIEESAGKRVVCKLDCEGSEYEIMRDLADARLIERVDCFMIEWHGRGPAEIEALLLEAGHTAVSLDPLNADKGMIYSFGPRREDGSH